MSHPPLFVINLTRERTRWAAIVALGAAYGLTPRRIAALDATHHAALVQDRLPPEDPTTPMSPSEAACAGSHLMALRCLLRSGSPWGVICEDDITFDARFPALFPQTLDRWMTVCDLVKLEGLVYAYTSTTGPCLATGPGVRLIVPPRPTLGAACYAVTRAGARQLLRLCTPPTAPWDHLLVAYERHQLAYAEVRPLLVWQSGAPTSITMADRPPQEHRRITSLWRGLQRLGWASWWIVRARWRQWRRR